MADIDEHVDVALSRDASEAEVRNVLERLGTPAELVAAAGPPPPALETRSFASPAGAIICLVAAEILCLLLPVSVPLWIVGLVMMARAQVWTERQKWLGFVALGSGLPVAFVFLAVSTFAVRTCSQVIENGVVVQDSCGGFDWVALVAWVVTLGYLALQGFTVWLLVRAARRR